MIFLKEAEKYIDNSKDIHTAEDAIDGAKDIIAEQISDSAEARKKLRDLFYNEAVISAKVVKKKEEEAVKFKDYFDFSERIAKIPGHRLLAIFRGKNSGFLKFNIKPDELSAVRLHRKNFCEV